MNKYGKDERIGEIDELNKSWIIKSLLEIFENVSKIIVPLFINLLLMFFK